jgi:hypothetical protein
MTVPDATATPSGSSVIRLGSCQVDLSAYTADDVVLTEQEVALLQQLYPADGKPVTRLELYRQVWGRVGNMKHPAGVVPGGSSWLSLLWMASVGSLTCLRGL